MKKLSKFSFLIVLLSFFISSNVFAETPTPTATKTADSKAQGVILAQVNFANAKIVSQENNKFDISFSLTNGEGLQTGIKYGITLIQNTKEGQYIADEKIYDDSLTLNPNSKIDKSIAYTAPSYPSGDYDIILSSKNSNNFPFATYAFRKVTLTSTSKGVTILPETCYLGVEGEKDSPKYSLMRVVDIKPEESMRLTCIALNSSDSTVSLTPSYDTHIISSFGDKVEGAGGSTDAITLKSLEKKEFSVLLPKASIPESYNINFTLNNNDIKSNIIKIPYLIRGSNAVIKSVSLDKDYYQRGDSALIFFVYFPSVDSYTKGRYDAALPTHIFSKIEIKNSMGLSCAKSQTKDLAGHVSTKVEFSIPIKSKCLNPKVTVTLTDEAGKVLDEKEFSIKTTSAPDSNSNASYMIILVVLLAIITIYLYLKKKNTPKGPAEGSNSTGNITMGIVFFFVMILGSIIPVNEVKAATVVDYTGRIPGLTTNTTYCNQEYIFGVGDPYAVSTDCYTLTYNIPVLLTYDVKGQPESPNSEFIYNGGELSSYGGLECANSSYCNGRILKLDVTDNYNQNKDCNGGQACFRWSEYSWFNNDKPLALTSSCNNFGGCSYTNFSQTIYNYNSRDANYNTDFSWYITHFDTSLLRDVYDNFVGSQTLFIEYPQPMVDVKVSDGTGTGNVSGSTVTIKEGETATIEWTSSYYPSWSPFKDITCSCRTSTNRTIDTNLCINTEGQTLSGPEGQFTVKPDKPTTYYITCKDTNN